MNELWEYKVESVDVGRYNDAMLELHLRPLGDQGWEVVHITERKNWCRDGVHLKAYFKRRKHCGAVAELIAAAKDIRDNPGTDAHGSVGYCAIELPKLDRLRDALAVMDSSA